MTTNDASGPSINSPTDSSIPRSTQPGDILEVVIETMLDDPLNVDPVEYYQGTTDIRATALARRSTRLTIATEVAAAFSEELHSIDELLAAAEAVNVRFTNRLGDKLGSNWLAEGERPTVELLDDKQMIAGKPLKCLLPLSLQARACLTAGEAATLLFNGYLAGAYGRTRSLYEMTVIATVLAIDSSYETSERYHASAVFERLHR